jgi:hypothetical protein
MKFQFANLGAHSGNPGARRSGGHSGLLEPAPTQNWVLW